MTNYIEYSRDDIDSNIAIRNQIHNATKIFVWKVRFSAPLNPQTVNNSNLYVSSPKDGRLSTNIKYNQNEQIIEIYPLVEYSPNTTYTLTITKNVQSITGKPLSTEINLPFKVLEATK